YQRQNKKENLLATPNRNSSPTYRWATPFTRLRKENSFGKFVKKGIFSIHHSSNIESDIPRKLKVPLSN
ncbi:hypothetical protein ACQCWD_30730, partial [Bacillus thuringiensis]